MWEVNFNFEHLHWGHTELPLLYEDECCQKYLWIFCLDFWLLVDIPRWPHFNTMWFWWNPGWNPSKHLLSVLFLSYPESHKVWIFLGWSLVYNKAIIRDWLTFFTSASRRKYSSSKKMSAHWQPCWHRYKSFEARRLSFHLCSQGEVYSTVQTAARRRDEELTNSFHFSLGTKLWSCRIHPAHIFCKWCKIPEEGGSSTRSAKRHGLYWIDQICR